MTRLFGLAALAALAVLTPPCRADLILRYNAVLTGAGESPPNASPGTGFAVLDYAPLAHSLHVHAEFSGLLGTTTASHIHSPTALPGVGTAPVATVPPAFPGFPLGVTSGTYDGTLDLTLLSSYNPPYVAAHGGTAASAEADLAASLAQGTAYFNIHTTVVPGGEIRGFLQPAAVPEPSSLALLALGGLGLAGWRRWTKRTA